MQLLLLSVLLITAELSAAEPVSDEQVRAAVRRAVPFLKEDMQTWRAERECAACHHGPMYVWTTNELHRAGYAVDREYARETLRWMLHEDDARVFRRPDNPRLSLATVFLGHALNTLDPDHPERQAGWERIREHWTVARRDGRWQDSVGRPPIFNSPQVITRWMTLALAADEGRGENGRQLLRESEAWLAQETPDGTQQGLVLRLWRETLRKEAARKAAALVQSLRKLQRADGGWSQAADRPSDAYAAGQTLFAFRLAGISATDPAVRQGLAFLTRTQDANGAWPMTSRIDPETNRGADDLTPIVYAAASWAALGMSGYVPEER